MFETEISLSKLSTGNIFHSSQVRTRRHKREGIQEKQHSKSVSKSKNVNNMMQYIHFTNGMLQKNI